MTSEPSKAPEDPVAFRAWLLEDRGRAAEWFDQILTPAEVCAAYPTLGKTPKVLANQRAAGRGPRFIKPPGRSTRVCYRRGDIIRYFEKCVVRTRDDDE